MAEQYPHLTQLGACAPLPASPAEAVIEKVANSQADTDYLVRARVHFDLPGHGPARFRASGDRLRARPMAGRIEIPEAVSVRSAITARSTRIAR
jgi:hypothetical protein